MLRSSLFSCLKRFLHLFPLKRQGLWCWTKPKHSGRCGHTLRVPERQLPKEAAFICPKSPAASAVESTEGPGNPRRQQMLTKDVRPCPAVLTGIWVTSWRQGCQRSRVLKWELSRDPVTLEEGKIFKTVFSFLSLLTIFSKMLKAQRVCVCVGGGLKDGSREIRKL